jgi:hypothetical protein
MKPIWLETNRRHLPDLHGNFRCRTLLWDLKEGPPLNGEDSTFSAGFAVPGVGRNPEATGLLKRSGHRDQSRLGSASEEMLTLQSISQRERNEFFKLLAELARTGRIWVIATIRADFWDRALEIPDLASMAAGLGRMDVPPPSKAELDEMIGKPAQMAGIAFEQDPTTQLPLDRVLAEHAAAEPGILPLLSFSLYTRDILASHKEQKNEPPDAGSRVLTHHSYKELDGLLGAIGSKAEEVFAQLPKTVRASLPYVLNSLVTVGVRSGGKPTARPAPLTNFAKGTPERKLVDAFLAPYARLFVVTAVGDEGPTVRVAHEALLTRWAPCGKPYLRKREKPSSPRTARTPCRSLDGRGPRSRTTVAAG